MYPRQCWNGIERLWVVQGFVVFHLLLQSCVSFLTHMRSYHHKLDSDSNVLRPQSKDCYADALCFLTDCKWCPEIFEREKYWLQKTYRRAVKEIEIILYAWMFSSSEISPLRRHLDFHLKRSGINPPAVNLLTRSRILLRLGVQKTQSTLGGPEHLTIPHSCQHIAPGLAPHTQKRHAQFRTVIGLLRWRSWRWYCQNSCLPVVCNAPAVCFQGKRKTFCSYPRIHSKWGCLPCALKTRGKCNE